MTKTRSQMKVAYWKYYLKNPKYWGNGFTEKRLEKIERIIFHDEHFWSDILDRHMGKLYNPEYLKLHYTVTYDHLIGNFTGMLMQCFVEQKIIKP